MTIDLASVAADITVRGDDAKRLHGAGCRDGRRPNGDGADDILVGAYENDDGDNQAGAIYAVFGDTDPNCQICQNTALVQLPVRPVPLQLLGAASLGSGCIPQR